MIQIKDLWKIFKEYKEKISKQKFYDFVDIVQREVNEYSIYNLSEVYSTEPSNDTDDKLLITNTLIRKGYNRFWYVKQTENNLNDCNGPYIPNKEELFKFDHDLFYESDEGKAMKDFISNLKTSGIAKKKYKDDFKETMLDLNGNEVRDKCLKDFVYLTYNEKFNIKYYRKYSEQLTKEYSIDCASKILNYIEMNIMIRDAKETMKFIQYTVDMIGYDFGVNLSMDQTEYFIDLYTKLFNASNRWANYGWSENELRKRYPINGPVSVEFGPNIQKMIDKGEYDMDELKDKLKQEGITLVEENENSYEVIMAENQKYLDIFAEYLKEQGYDDVAINNHVSRVEYYINDYLMWGLPKPMQDGCSLDVINFIEYKVNEKVIPANVLNIDLFINSILLFYKCMSEKGYVSKDAYKECISDVKNSKDEMVEDYYDKNPEPIDVDEVIDLIEKAHGYGSAYMNVKTGESELVPKDEDYYSGDIDELYDKLDGFFWRQLPDIKEDDIMRKFSSSLKNKAQNKELKEILNHEAAYRDFIDAIIRMNIKDRYYNFYENELLDLAETWMIENIEEYEEFGDFEDEEDFEEA